MHLTHFLCTYIHNRDEECLLRGTNRFLKYNLATFHLQRLIFTIGFSGKWGRFFYASVSQVSSECHLSVMKKRSRIRLLCKFSICLTFLYL